jgi:hypothetical protein
MIQIWKNLFCGAHKIVLPLKEQEKEKNKDGQTRE